MNTNVFGKYNYRNCEDIYAAVIPLLVEYEASINVTDEIVLVADRIYIKATATFYHKDFSISTTAYAREEKEIKGFESSRITGSISSYARKYALCGLLLIDGEKDAGATNDNAVIAKNILEKAKKVTNREYFIILWNIILKTCTIIKLLL